MLSCLSQGVGSLDGEVHVDLNNIKRKESNYTLPCVVMSRPSTPSTHRHGVTITPRIKSAQSSTRSEKPDGEMVLPKTFLTRKGALLLFAAPEHVPSLSDEEKYFLREKMRLTEFQELSHRIGTLRRLTKSVLQYGDEEEYDKENTSISDNHSRIIVKFLRGLDERSIDMKAQPGGDFGSYLRDVKSRASTRSPSTTVRFDDNVSTLDDSLRRSPDILTASGERLAEQSRTSRSSSAVSSRRSVLSTDRLTASLKSSGHFESPTPLAAQQTADEAQLLINQGRARSAHPRLRRRGSAPRRSQDATDQTQDGKIRRSEHRRQQLLRQQRAMPGAEETKESDNAESRSQITDNTGLDTQEYGSILEEREPSRGSSPRSKKSSIVTDQTAASVVTEVPGGVSNVVITQKDTDHANGGDEAVPEGGVRDRQNEEDDRVSISSSVLEEQDICLSTDKQGHLEKGLPPPGDDQYDDDDIYDDDGDSEDDEYEEYFDEYEEEYALRDGATQPLMPQYTGSLLTGGATFSFNNTLPETQDLDDIVIEETSMLPHRLDSVTGPQPDLGGSDDESDQELATPTAPPPSPPTSRMARQSPDLTDLAPPSTPVSSRHGSLASIHTSRPTSGYSRRSLTVPDMPYEFEASADSFDQAKSASSSRSTPVDELVPPEFLREQGFIADGSTLKTETDPERTFDSGFGGTETSRLSVKRDSDFGTSGPTGSSSTFLSDSGVPSVVPSVVVKVTPEDGQEDRELDKDTVTLRPTIRADSWKPPHEPEDVSKAIDISSRQSNHEYTDTLHETPKSSKQASPKHRPRRPSIKRKKKSETEEENARERKLEKEVEHLMAPDLANKYDEGMTAEELELEQKILEEKMKKAEEKVTSTDRVPSATAKKPKKEGVKTKEPARRKGSKGTKEPPQEDLEAKRRAIHEQKAQEKLKRLEEAMKLQEKILEKEISRKIELEEAEKKTKPKSSKRKSASKKHSRPKSKSSPTEIEAQMASLAEEASEAEQLEEEAKMAMIASRQSAREDRELRRKQELDRRRQEASEKRQREREMMERARQKELEMLEMIGGPDAGRQLQEEDRLKQEEEEMLEMERLEEEERLVRLAGEEEEARIAEIERQAEDEALAKLRQERDEAERKRRKLMVIAEKAAEEEERKRQAFLEEQREAEEERRKLEDEENRKKEEERQRLLQLKKMEEEARERMRVEFEKRRETLLKRREKNLESRNHLQGIRHSQGMTRPYVFSYYVLWPRQTYERLIGGEDDKKKGFRRRPKPKSAPPK